MDQHVWQCPEAGPAATPAALVAWLLTTAIGPDAVIGVSRRDYAALAATRLAPRIGIPPHGIVQPGTVWLCGVPRLV